MKENSQQGFERAGEGIDIDKWLLHSDFRIPLNPGLDWTVTSLNPYKVDMSRYFTNIADELDLWLKKDGMAGLDRRSSDRLNESFLTTQIAYLRTEENNWLMDSKPKVNQSARMTQSADQKMEENDWLLETKSKDNPMTKFSKMDSDPSRWKKKPPFSNI